MTKNRECPKCKETGHDKDKDHLFLMKDGVTWYCHRHVYHSDSKPYMEVDGIGIEYDPSSGHVDVSTLPCGKHFIRDIKPEISGKYGVRVESRDCSGDITHHYYPITRDEGKVDVGYKVRDVEEKDFYSTCKLKGVNIDLFGYKTLTSKRPEHLIITEGELDAMAVYQMLSPSVKKVNVLSLPQGVNNLLSLKTNMKLLEKAYNLYYYPDQDTPGFESIEKVTRLLPNVRIIYTSEKDGCDMLKAGKSAEMLDAFKNAETYTPKCIVSVSDVLKESIKPVSMGLSYPFDELTKRTYGLRTKQLIGVGGGPGTGKTTFIEQIEKDIVFTHGEKVAIFALEEDPSWTMKKLIGSVMCQPIHIPDVKYDLKEAERIAKLFEGKVFFYDSYEYTDWKDIESAIRYFHSEGVKYFFIDPLSALHAHLSASDANVFLTNAMYSMSKLVKSLDITIFHNNHLNNPPSSTRDHGEGGRVKGGQFSGSRAQWKFSTALWGLERNQLADDEEDRNIVTVRIIKDRMVGATGSFTLRYDKKTGVLVDDVPVISGGF